MKEAMNTLRRVGLLTLLVLVLIFPVLLSPNNVVTEIGIYTLIFAMGATGWNIFSGYTGYISVGHTVYFGVGAYTMALTCQNWNIPGGFLPLYVNIKLSPLDKGPEQALHLLS